MQFVFCERRPSYKNAQNPLQKLSPLNFLDVDLTYFVL